MRSNANKNIIYSIILLLLVAIVYLYRQNQQQPDETYIEENTGKVTFSGNTMGTSYRVVYLDGRERDFKKEVDSLLVVFNQSLSTYIEDSEISRFNREDTLAFELPFFYKVLKSSKEIYQKTNGAFDPTVGPMVNLWGFGPGGPQLKDSVNINQMLPLVNFKAVEFSDKIVYKKEGMYLDFSAIAKGFGVDVVAEFLENKGIEDMLIEIGGELVARGLNDRGELWKVGINKPEELGRADQLVSIIALENKSLATSGNYRNYYQAGDMKISHTIDPSTGRPVTHGLLSATVIADDCMTADAYATAMMVMGTEKSIALQQNLEGVEIFLIFNNENGEMDYYASEGIKPYLSFIED